MQKIIYNLFSFTLILLFTACGSDNTAEQTAIDDTNETVLDITDDITSIIDNETKTFSGVIVDGYISGATVCLDVNVNGLCDTNEPSTTTDENGTFSFIDIVINEDLLIPVIAKGGVDTATNQPFNGELKNIIDLSSISEEETLVVTPLTDLVAVSFLQTSTKDVEALTSSKEDVAEAFSLNVDEVSTDPMTNVVVFAKTQEVQQIKALIETVALKAQDSNATEEVLEKLRSDITEALVTQIKDTNTTLDVEQVMIEVETLAEITIPENEKTFVVAQTQEIQTTMSTLADDNTTDVDTLDEIQAGLEAEQEVAHERLEVATTDEVIEVVIVSSIETLMTSGEELQVLFPEPVTDENISTLPITNTVPEATALPIPPAVPTL